MLYACVARFDVMENFKSFLFLGWTKQGLSLISPLLNNICQKQTNFYFAKFFESKQGLKGKQFQKSRH